MSKIENTKKQGKRTLIAIAKIGLTSSLQVFGFILPI